MLQELRWKIAGLLLRLVLWTMPRGQAAYLFRLHLRRFGEEHRDTAQHRGVAPRVRIVTHQTGVPDEWCAYSPERPDTRLHFGATEAEALERLESALRQDEGGEE